MYANRVGNGNEASGDGYKYRGRGLFQLTGKANYQSFTTFYQDKYDATKDFVNNPELLGSDEEIAVRSALWFYKVNVLDKIAVNKDTNVDKVSERINSDEETKIMKKRKDIFNKIKPHIDCN